MDDPVIPFDLTRMFLGAEPWLFYAEILFRCIVIYTYSLILLRWIGGRSIAQLSLVEFLLVISLGSAVGDALFYPEVPLLHALAAITVAVLIAKGIDMLTLRSQRLNAVVDGTPVRVLSDGVLDLPGLMCRNMSLAEVASVLRQNGISNLGAVRAAYIEPSGHMSIFKAQPTQAGLRIEPPAELLPLPPASGGGAACCVICGWVTGAKDHDRCDNCDAKEWTDAT